MTMAALDVQAEALGKATTLQASSGDQFVPAEPDAVYWCFAFWRSMPDRLRRKAREMELEADRAASAACREGAAYARASLANLDARPASPVMVPTSILERVVRGQTASCRRSSSPASASAGTAQHSSTSSAATAALGSLT
ncbi:hypothetical protein GCM10022293_51530 [Azospirillum formosense]